MPPFAKLAIDVAFGKPVVILFICSRLELAIINERFSFLQDRIKIYRVSITDPDSRDGEKYDPKQ
jgi:hypothetical protein